MQPITPFNEANRHAARFLNRTRAALLASALLLLAACSPPATIDVALSENSVEILRGTQAEIEVTLTRSTADSEDVQLAVSGLPNNVEATFSPAVLSGTSLTSTLTLDAPAAAVDGTHALTVTATGPGLNADAALELEIVSLTVTGTIKANFATPVTGVSVGSQDATAVTDGIGGFELTGLAVPYDLSVWSTTDKWARFYQGLTASEVELEITYAGLPPVARSTTVTGTLTGDAIPVGANQMVRVCAEGLDGDVLGCTVADVGSSDFSLPLQWYGPETREIRLHLLQIESNASGLPLAYPGYASTDAFMVADLVPEDLPAIELGDALDTTTVALDIDAPAAPALTAALVQVAADVEIMVMGINDGATTYDVLMPVMPDVSYTFLSLASLEQSGWASDITGSTALVTIPEQPNQTSPTDGATDVTLATEFTATTSSEGPITWLWSDGTQYDVGLTTMSRTVTIPDTSEYGFSLPSATGFSWNTVASGGTSTEAGLKAENYFFGTFATLISGFGFDYHGAGSVVASSPLSFTTAP